MDFGGFYRVLDQRSEGLARTADVSLGGRYVYLKNEIDFALASDRSRSNDFIDLTVGARCSFASGYGLLVNKKAGRESQMEWHRLTIGPGLAVKAIYALAVFHDQELLERFEQGKWAVGGQAEASFIFGDFGGALDAAWVFNKKVDVHYVTHTGVALELELIGAGKVTNDRELNEALGR